MAVDARLLALSALMFTSGGVSQVVQTQLTVTAEVGGEVRFSCRLLEPKDVRQVTWQKVCPGGAENLASSSKLSGQTVYPKFNHKVAFADASLQNCSILVRRVAAEDEGCYRCLFSTARDGAFIGRTCLQLYELQVPLLRVHRLKPTQEPVVWCRVTGRPAPTVALSAATPDLRLSNVSSVSVPNDNGTVTITYTALLSGLRGRGGARVRCAAWVEPEHPLEVFETLPEDQETLGEYISLGVGLAVVVLIVLISALGVSVWCKQKKKKGDAEMIKTPLRPNLEPSRSYKTPLMHQTNELLTQRTPHSLRQPMPQSVRQRTPNSPDDRKSRRLQPKQLSF